MKKKYFIIGLLVVFVSISSVFFYLNKQTTDIEYPGITYKGIDEDMISTIPDSNVEYLKNELILQLKNYEENYVDNLIKEYKGEIVGEIEATGTYQILFNQVEDFDKLNNIKLKLEKDENVDSIKFNKIYKVSEQGYYPNDEKWLDKWDDKNDLQTWGLRAIKAPEAWEYLKNRSVHKEETIEIGIFEETGVDYLHEDLKDNFI